MLHVALYQPKIPPNTGNIARQCVGMDAVLHLIGPIEFDLSDHAVKRAGLDYWPHLELIQHLDPEAFVVWLDGRIPWLITKSGKTRYDQPEYKDGDIILFGNELAGLPQTWRQRWPDRGVFIPILGQVRSYNLSNAVAVVLAQACLSIGAYGQ